MSPLAWGCSRCRQPHTHLRLSCPHSRGDVPHAAGTHGGYSAVVPTRVGMFPNKTTLTRQNTSCPHSRGDVPFCGRDAELLAELSPLAWGCSCRRLRGRYRVRVVPTRVGMFPNRYSFEADHYCCPHSRGDVPHAKNIHHGVTIVVPTRVGMFPHMMCQRCVPKSCPHSRGDVPVWRVMWPRWPTLSPLAWGCSPRRQYGFYQRKVVPTRVGMFPEC